ncbi:hypothetical protein, partial [Halorubrum sp. SD626R]
MDRSSLTQYRPVAVLVMCVIVVSVAAVGVAQASAETDARGSPNITDSGDTENLFSFENRHSISNIEIRTDNEKSSGGNVTLYINLIELRNANIDLSEVAIGDTEVRNGRVIGTNKTRNDNQTIHKIKINQSNTSNPIQVDSVQLAGVNGTNGKKAGDIQYRLGIADANSTVGYKDLESDGQIRQSEKFDFVDGSITVRDQATASTTLRKNSRTSVGVTVSKVVSNANSTIVLANENGDILSYKSRTVQELSSKNGLSLNTSTLGGSFNVYLIPDSRVGTQLDGTDKDTLDQIKQSAVAEDEFQMYLGTVQFNNQEYESRRITNITNITSEVRDISEANTPYIVSIHPITADGEIIYSDYIGYSNVLTGVNDGLTVPVRNISGDRGSIWHSNRYAATIRLAPRQKVGEPVNLNSTYLLPNSDIKKQFIEGGVSDSSDIHISNVHSSQVGSSEVDRLFNGTKSDRDRVYSGEVIGYRNELSQENGRVKFGVNCDRRRRLRAS